MNKLYRITVFLLAVSIAACTSNQSNQYTAGNDEDKDIGIGGTGMLATTGSETGSGLGGTGILGEITGFGSVFVNGIEVEYDDETAFTVNGKPSAPQQLEIGDVVEILTTDGNKFTRAKVINLRHEVVGTVESVDPQTFSFTVNGQSVVQAINKVSLPEVGTKVAVSGFRIDEKTILSTRTSPAGETSKLLRTHTVLPFKGKTDRWLVQTHVQIDRVSFELDGSVHTIELENKSRKTISDRLGIKVLKLQKAVSGQLKVDQVIEPRSLPRGRKNPVSANRPENTLMPGSLPGSLPGSTQGMPPGNMPGATQGAQPAPVQNMKR